MNIDEMNSRKKELGYTNQDISKLSGVPVSTVNKILCGATKAPRRATLLALGSVLSKPGTPENPFQVLTNDPELIGKIVIPEEGSSVDYLDHVPTGDAVVREPAPAYTFVSDSPIFPVGTLTIEDYLELPDDARLELINGIFYNMAAPTSVHQFIAGMVHHQLASHILANNGKCMPLIAPVDVQVDMSDKTVVQPDVMVTCRPKELLRNGRLYGAPDFILEVLSPSTRMKDLTIKLEKYYGSGVREYWIADLEYDKLLVYDLENGMLIPEIYDLPSKVPVKIWNGKCVVDFDEIYELLKMYME